MATIVTVDYIGRRKDIHPGMTKAMAVELSQGIRINCVAPGFIASATLTKALDGDPGRRQKVVC